MATTSLVPAQEFDAAEARNVAARAAARRLALMGEQDQLRQRYEEVMQWANPPWDPISKRPDPRPEKVTALP